MDLAGATKYAPIKRLCSKFGVKRTELNVYRIISAIWEHWPCS